MLSYKEKEYENYGVKVKNIKHASKANKERYDQLKSMTNDY
jgi:hypothetical protein